MARPVKLVRRIARLHVDGLDNADIVVKLCGAGQFVGYSTVRDVLASPAGVEAVRAARARQVKRPPASRTRSDPKDEPVRPTSAAYWRGPGLDRDAMVEVGPHQYVNVVSARRLRLTVRDHTP